MPRGPFGFPRITSLGPFVKEVKERSEGSIDAQYGWDNCSESARDEVDEEICRSIKNRAIELLEDPDIFPPVDDVSDINQGFCRFISESLFDLEEEQDDVRVLVDGTTGFKHYWIEYNGKHFDAEVPTGVGSPDDLPAFRRFGVNVSPNEVDLGDNPCGYL